MFLNSQMRVTEDLIQQAMLRLMVGGRIWTNSRLKQALKIELSLSPADKARANHRPNEAKWEALVNNALSPERSNSLTKKGFVETVERGHHRITDEGRRELENLNRFSAAFYQVVTAVKWASKE